MDTNQTQVLGGALTAVLAALGVAPGVGPIISGLLAVITVAPELYDLIKQDVDMFTNGQITLEQLQSKFATTQATFDKLSARWAVSTS